MDLHPNPDRIQSLVQGMSPSWRSLLRHVTNCPKCGELFCQAVGEESNVPDGVLPWRLHEALADAGGSLLDVDLPVPDEPALDCDTDDLIDEIVALAEEGVDLAATEPRNAWHRVEALLLESRKLRHDRAHLSERVALLAVRAAAQLDCTVYGTRLVADLRARAWTYVSVARRLGGDFQGAHDACSEAWRFLETGTGDVLERALLLECEGTLLKDQWRFAEAGRSLRHAASLFSLVGDDHATGRSLAILANLYQLDDDLPKAIETLRQAAERIDPTLDATLLLSIRHNLASYLIDSGDYAQAQRLLDDLSDLGDQVAEPLHLRRRWLQAQIHHGQGRFAEAEAELTGVQEGFIAAGLGYDAATVSIELAILFAEQGRFSEMRRLADEMLPIFRAQDIGREALAALAIFQQAARMEEVTLKLARDLADYFGKVRNQPSLRFEPSR